MTVREYKRYLAKSNYKGQLLGQLYNTIACKISEQGWESNWHLQRQLLDSNPGHCGCNYNLKTKLPTDGFEPEYNGILDLTLYHWTNCVLDTYHIVTCCELEIETMWIYIFIAQRCSRPCQKWIGSENCLCCLTYLSASSQSLPSRPPTCQCPPIAWAPFAPTPPQPCLARCMRAACKCPPPPPMTPSLCEVPPPPLQKAGWEEPEQVGWGKASS